MSEQINCASLAEARFIFNSSPDHHAESSFFWLCLNCEEITSATGGNLSFVSGRTGGASLCPQCAVANDEQILTMFD